MTGGSSELPCRVMIDKEQISQLLTDDIVAEQLGEQGTVLNDLTQSEWLSRLILVAQLIEEIWSL